MLRRLPMLIVGLAVGLLLGVIQPWRHEGGSLKSPLVRSATDVQAADWHRYRNTAYGFAVKYPASFAMSEERGQLVLTQNGAAAGQATSITFQKIRGSIQSQLDPSMQQGGWKIADRQTYALTTPYFSDDPAMLWASYLFVRDFPKPPAAGSYVMIKARIVMPRSNPELAQAKAQGMLDPESILTTPEQILSTFRFLEYDELPNNGRKK